MKSDLTEKVADLAEPEVLEMVQKRLDEGQDPMELFDACRQGMVKVGERFEQNKYYIGDLMMAGEIFKQVSAILEPAMKGKTTEKKGDIVFGTVQGDVHDIGKDLVIALLRADGFNVHDMGIDCPAENFVNKVRETGATVVGLSGLVTVAFDSMKATVAALKKAGLREKLKVMIGGGTINEEVVKYTGADSFGKDATEAVALANKLIK